MGAILARLWGSARVALNGVVYDLTACDALICEDEKGLMGFLHYDARGDEGGALAGLPAAERGRGERADRGGRAHSAGGGRKAGLIVVTTNDNTDAMRFYQRRGVFADRRAVRRRDALPCEVKPEIPLIGESGIPIRHEMVFGMEL